MWEPDVLIRHEDASRDNASSNLESNAASSIQLEPVISQSNSTRSQVKALVTDSEDRYACCGRDDGSVAIRSATDGSRVREAYKHPSTVPVIALEWSKSSKFIVSVDDAGCIICKRLEMKDFGKWAAFPVLDIRTADPVRQFLFHPNESALLIPTDSNDVVWSICGKTKKETCRKNWPFLTGRRWNLCPVNPSKLLWIEPYKMVIFGWENLESHQSQQTMPTQAVTAKPEPGAGRCATQ